MAVNSILKTFLLERHAMINLFHPVIGQERFRSQFSNTSPTQDASLWGNVKEGQDQGQLDPVQGPTSSSVDRLQSFKILIPVPFVVC